MHLRHWLLRPRGNEYRRDILAAALRIDDETAARIVLPRVAAPGERVGTGRLGGREVAVGAGMGDNAGSALGMGLTAGDVVVSIGTSGVVCGVTDAPARDASGLVSGFADATGRFLPLAATLNGARVLDATARLLGVGHEELATLALAAEPGAGGLIFVPFLEGERTPNLPDATGSLHGMTLGSLTRENLARAAAEGVVCALVDALGCLEDATVDRLPRAAHRRRGGVPRGPGRRRRPVPRPVAMPARGVRCRSRRRAPGGGDGRHRRPARVELSSVNCSSEAHPEVVAAYRRASVELISAAVGRSRPRVLLDGRERGEAGAEGGAQRRLADDGDPRCRSSRPRDAVGERLAQRLPQHGSRGQMPPG